MEIVLKNTKSQYLEIFSLLDLDNIQVRDCSSLITSVKHKDLKPKIGPNPAVGFIDIKMNIPNLNYPITMEISKLSNNNNIINEINSYIEENNIYNENFLKNNFSIDNNINATDYQLD